MKRLFVVAVLGTASVAALAVAQDQPARHYPLSSTAGLRPHNVATTAVTHRGRAAVRMTMSDAARERVVSPTPAARDEAATTGATDEYLAVIEGLTFGDGTLEAEIAGSPQAGVFEGARGFVGLAFRLSDDLQTYDAFYLRPTNGRADDQVRRNHSVQYISHPAWTWFRLRSEFPEKYESYVDLEPGAWTRVKVDVRGTQARLFVHDQPQPTLIVHDLKTGAGGRGGVALWIDVGTEAHFRNLTVTPAAAAPSPQTPK